MKKLVLSLTFLLVSTMAALAVEGMWLPLLLSLLNEKEMQSMGMKMSAEDIYSVNKGSLKDAIVQFGGGCTSEIISPQGLLLTNHHCGYGRIQAHSSLEHNYLEDGFWAMSLKDELPNPGLTATLISRIEDVTEAALKGVTDDMDKRTRQSTIDKNLNDIQNAAQKETWEEVMVRPFFQGNQYFLFVTVTYKDIRLVGAPPSSIGKFGADTDNWVWPRHTGDFSIFRIYADKDNRPAAYSPDNQPYKPKHFLPISLDGVTDGDFTLVFGFPGRTNEYLPSYAVQQIVDVLDPAKIAVRDRTLAIWNAAMRQDPEVKIQYASKQSSLANAWKKWEGEVLGLTRTNAVQKKKDYEAEFMKVVALDPNFKKYGTILPEFEQLYRDIAPYALAKDYYDEITSRNVELLRTASQMNRLVAAYNNEGQPGYDKMKDRLAASLDGFYKNYRPGIDQQVFAVLMDMMAHKVDKAFLPAYFLNQVSNGDYEAFAENIFSNSFLTDADRTVALLGMAAGDVLKAIQNDPACQLAKAFDDTYNDNIIGPYNGYDERIDDLMQRYMKAQMEVFPNKTFYPDANSTLRCSYGRVQGYKPRDAVSYFTKTYLDGVMEKYVPGDYEFDVPEKLQELYRKKDYGPYAENNRMPVCFIGSNHTTGGNSGSPAIDAHGNLIGLNFDRVWEGTMSDYNYDLSLCRNIMVDIRYVLFIIDKYAGAGHLVKEMSLVHPKQNSTGKKKNSRLKVEPKMEYRKEKPLKPMPQKEPVDH
ncbi:MAG: S46 family peptidase [Lewinellaceae bacterium]|nr:S46 family peptidase [Saprospiraceae bacterium]MCB9339515.1 S46 family peptidase [Lewinellaceae bacterium]